MLEVEMYCEQWDLKCIVNLKHFKKDAILKTFYTCNASGLYSLDIERLERFTRKLTEQELEAQEKEQQRFNEEMNRKEQERKEQENKKQEDNTMTNTTTTLTTEQKETQKAWNDAKANHLNALEAVKVEKEHSKELSAQLANLRESYKASLFNDGANNETMQACKDERNKILDRCKVSSDKLQALELKASYYKEYREEKAQEFLLEVFTSLIEEKYQNKRLGDKTSAQLANDMYDLTGYKGYVIGGWNERYLFRGGNNFMDTVEIKFMKGALLSEDNKLLIPNLENMYTNRQHDIEKVESLTRETLALEKQIQAQAKALNDLIAKYNQTKPNACKRKETIYGL